MTKDLENDSAENVELAADVFDIYGDYIYRVIFYQVKDENTAMDIYQDFFLSVVAYPIPENVKNEKVYIYRRLNNHISTSIRRSTRYKQNLEKYQKNTGNPEKISDNKSAYIDREKEKKLLGQAEQKLRSSEAKALTLRYKKGYSSEKTAKIMNIHINSVYKYVTKGLKKMRNYVEKNKGESNE